MQRRQARSLPASKVPALSRRQIFRSATCAAVLAAIPRYAIADNYPSRPIRLVIPYAAGGSGDQIGRPWAEKMGSLLGPIYVENIAGAGGALGCSVVAREAGDGYSLLLGNGSTHVIIPLAATHPAYDAARDFRAIYRLISSALAFVIHPSLPVNNMEELVTYAKANTGRLSYGSPGVGTGNHLIGEMFKRHSGLADIVHVPYRGASPAINDLIGGQILLAIAVMSSQLLQLNQAGRLRILAVTSGRRLSGAPQFPTVIESGMPDLEYEG